jgi:hypothetical protein
MTTRCLFLVACVEPDLEFADVEALAAHIHALRAGRPVVLSRVIVTTPDHNRGHQGVSVRLAESGEGLGYALVGEKPAGVQYDLLGGALARLELGVAA